MGEFVDCDEVGDCVELCVEGVSLDALAGTLPVLFDGCCGVCL